MKNHIPLYTEIDGSLVSHFSLHEFENPQGWVIIHPKTVEALELARAGVRAQNPGQDIIFRITCTTRTLAQNEALGRKYGFTDEGGKVSRRSWHLEQFGGIAVDFVAWSVTQNCNISPVDVARVARLYFDFVKWYSDSHVHGDLRSLVNL